MSNLWATRSREQQSRNIKLKLNFSSLVASTRSFVTLFFHGCGGLRWFSIKIWLIENWNFVCSCCWSAREGLLESQVKTNCRKFLKVGSSGIQADGLRKVSFGTFFVQNILNTIEIQQSMYKAPSQRKNPWTSAPSLVHKTKLASYKWNCRRFDCSPVTQATSTPVTSNNYFFKFKLKRRRNILILIGNVSLPTTVKLFISGTE